MTLQSVGQIIEFGLTLVFLVYVLILISFTNKGVLIANHLTIRETAIWIFNIAKR
ncbi:MAG: hypothetical protein ABJP66_20380 [Hyphomicrobiales bacterium]